MTITQVGSGEVVKGNYFKDILEQPEVLKEVIHYLAGQDLDTSVRERLHTCDFRRVLLTGMGSSFHALYPLHLALSNAGFSSHWIETAELLLGFEPLYGSDTLLIGVSQSGESAEMETLVKRANEFGHFIGITNDGDSTLGRGADTLLLLKAGIESTVSCKTYLSTLAVLHWLSAFLIQGDTERAIAEIVHAEAAVREYLTHWHKHVTELLPLVDGITNIFVTGRGNSLTSACTSGLILKESTRQHAEGMSAAAFRHGPLEMANDRVLVLIFEGGDSTFPLHLRLANDIVKGGGCAILIGSHTPPSGVFLLPEMPSAVMPLVEILPVQMLSLAIAARDGFEAGKFKLASKITNVS